MEVLEANKEMVRLDFRARIIWLDQKSDHILNPFTTHDFKHK